MRLALALALATGAALSALPPSAIAYRTGPPAAHTGGFGEGTCTACHWSEADERRDGGLTLEVPAAYEPGKTYTLRVRLEDPALRSAGFQLSARFDDGAGVDTGAQAGSLAASDSGVVVVTSGKGIQYASHTDVGVAPAEPGRAAWIVRWTAPAGGPVVFHAAANAADDDASEFGDRIHASQARSRER